MPVVKANEREYYLDGYLNKLLLGLKNAVLNKATSAVIVVDGRSGMGKTTISIQIAFQLDPNFNLNKIYFEPGGFLEDLASANKGSCLIFDEAMLLSSRSALSEINKMVIMAMALIRSKQLFVIFCVNSIFDLDRNLALSRADLLIHVFGSNLIDRGHFSTYFKPKGQFECRIKTLYLLGKKMYSYSRPSPNFHGKFYIPFLVDEKEYEARKQESINKFLTMGGSKLIKRDAYLFNIIIYMKESLGYNVLKISEIFGCTDRTIYNLLSKNAKPN